MLLEKACFCYAVGKYAEYPSIPRWFAMAFDEHLMLGFWMRLPTLQVHLHLALRMTPPVIHFPSQWRNMYATLLPHCRSIRLRSCSTSRRGSHSQLPKPQPHSNHLSHWSVFTFCGHKYFLLSTSAAFMRLQQCCILLAPFSLIACGANWSKAS